VRVAGRFVRVVAMGESYYELRLIGGRDVQASAGGSFSSRTGWRSGRRPPSNTPPMQDPASFDLAAVKKQIAATIKAHQGQ
jgi:hypothetical protein